MTTTTTTRGPKDQGKNSLAQSKFRGQRTKRGYWNGSKHAALKIWRGLNKLRVVKEFTVCISFVKMDPQRPISTPCRILITALKRNTDWTLLKNVSLRKNGIPQIALVQQKGHEQMNWLVLVMKNNQLQKIVRYRNQILVLSKQGPQFQHNLRVYKQV